MPKRSRPKREPIRSADKKNFESPTFYKDHIDPRHYRVEGRRGWNYEDAHPNVVNPILPLEDNYNKHLVLYDSRGVPRFTIAHDTEPSLAITSIQRARTPDAYEDAGEGKKRWSPELETKLGHEFKSQLGMHPAEFLLSDLIHMYREDILDHLRSGGRPPRLSSSDVRQRPHIYKPIVSRFFSERKLTRIPGAAIYELDPGKERVRKILGLSKKEAREIKDALKE